MRNPIYRILIVFITCIVVVLITCLMYFKNDFANKREINEGDELTGQRIGVITAYNTDYFLSDRKDITLKRYDSESDLLMAMCYGQIDAAAVDESTYIYMSNKVTGMKGYSDIMPKDQMAAILNEANTELNKAFNDFIALSKDFDEVKDIQAKFKSGYYTVDGNTTVEETGTGEVLSVGYNALYPPSTFYDVKNDKPAGYEVDFIRLFANYMNYRIEWQEVTENTLFAKLSNDQIQIALAAYSKIYDSEFEATPYYELSDGYLDIDTVLMVVDDKDNLSIAAISEE